MTRRSFPVAKLSLALFMVHALFAHTVLAQPLTVHGKNVVATLELARNFHRQSETLPSDIQRVEQKKRLYVSMATQLTASHDFDHLPFPEKPKEEWMQTAETVANGLKLNVNYQVVTAKEDPVIWINEKIADNLYQNVRLIAWYRDQLSDDKKKSSFRGSESLARLIDEYFRSLSKSLPPIKVRKQGNINVAHQQKLRISNTEIWEILSIINRYFFYKSQIVGASDQKVRADLMLVESMSKTAVIYGAKPPSSGLTRIKSELSENGVGWHQAGHEALESWNAVVKQHQTLDSNVVTIEIPSKPQAKAPPPKNPNEFPSDVEDIKEIGGIIFIKRKGKWRPWTPK